MRAGPSGRVTEIGNGNHGRRLVLGNGDVRMVERLEEPLHEHGRVRGGGTSSAPWRYLSRYGQLLEHAPCCERDLHEATGTGILAGSSLPAFVEVPRERDARSTWTGGSIGRRASRAPAGTDRHPAVRRRARQQQAVEVEAADHERREPGRPWHLQLHTL